jgi:hypothetical protein
MTIRCQFACVLGLVLLPSIGAAGPLVPTRFLDSSKAGAHEAGVFRFPDSSNVVDDCLGNPVVCETNPTAAMQSYLRSDASAFTDGLGGSGLHLRSRDGHVQASAETVEEGDFDVTGDPVDVHIQGFFPSITLFGIFAPGSELAYDVVMTFDGLTLFHTHGVLTDAGFMATGDDVGAIFDDRHHTVSVPAFSLDRTVREEARFHLNMTKTLILTGTDWVEIADAQMTDPEDVSAPGIVRNGVSAVVDDVPEPAVLSLMGLALVARAALRRRAAPPF